MFRSLEKGDAVEAFSSVEHSVPEVFCIEP